MNKERAREVLKNECCYECSWGCRNPIECNNKECDYRQAIITAIESLDENERLKKEKDYILEKAKAELKDNEWVDVKDGLPKKSGWYWVTKKFDFKGEFEYQNETDYEVDKEWFDSTKNEFDFTHKYIIAWRTYEPPPYKRK